MDRLPGESANDRNDRAIRITAKWYNKHLSIKKHEVRTILLTDDNDNRTKAKNDGIIACSIEEYVKSLTDHQTLQDKLSQKNYDLDSSKTVLFPPHLSTMTIHDGIKTGKFLQGTFLASRENYLEGSVNVENFEKFVSKNR